jgi:hypothetical protein
MTNSGLERVPRFICAWLGRALLRVYGRLLVGTLLLVARSSSYTGSSIQALIHVVRSSQVGWGATYLLSYLLTPGSMEATSP